MVSCAAYNSQSYIVPESDEITVLLGVRERNFQISDQIKAQQDVLMKRSYKNIPVRNFVNDDVARSQCGVRAGKVYLGHITIYIFIHKNFCTSKTMNYIMMTGRWSQWILDSLHCCTYIQEKGLAGHLINNQGRWCTFTIHSLSHNGRWRID